MMETYITKRWLLLQQEILLGELVLREIDQPWFLCEFRKTQAFDNVEALFEEELRLLNTDQMDAWQQAYEQIDNLKLMLKDPDEGTTLSDFLLHIKGTDAWFRY